MQIQSSDARRYSGKLPRGDLFETVNKNQQENYTMQPIQESPTVPKPKTPPDPAAVIQFITPDYYELSGDKSPFLIIQLPPEVSPGSFTMIRN